MGKIISIANQKGGVGKTTTAINLAASLAVIEHPTLVIDIDPQSNTTSGLGIEPKTVTNSIYEVMVGGVAIQNAVRETEMPYLDLVPAHINLVGAEIEMVDRDKRERILLKAIGDISEKYDFVIIDCPPSLGLLTINALTASNSVLIPVQCEYYALEGLGQLLNTIKIVRQHLNKELDIEGVLLTMYDTRTRLSNQVVEEVKRYFDEKVFSTIISRNIRLAEAPSFGKPAILYDASSVGAKNYLSLGREIIQNNKKFLKSSAVLSKS